MPKSSRKRKDCWTIREPFFRQRATGNVNLVSFWYGHQQVIGELTTHDCIDFLTMLWQYIAGSTYVPAATGFSQWSIHFSGHDI